MVGDAPATNVQVKPPGPPPLPPSPPLLLLPASPPLPLPLLEELLPLLPVLLPLPLLLEPLPLELALPEEPPLEVLDPAPLELLDEPVLEELPEPELLPPAPASVSGDEFELHADSPRTRRGVTIRMLGARSLDAMLIKPPREMAAPACAPRRGQVDRLNTWRRKRGQRKSQRCLGPDGFRALTQRVSKSDCPARPVRIAQYAVPKDSQGDGKTGSCERSCNTNLPMRMQLPRRE
jgi:hypothetical protein